MDNTAEHITRLATVLARHNGKAISTISRLSTGSGDIVTRLVNGCSITTRRAERTLSWFSENWPEDLNWPEDIPRPEAQHDAA